jgi:spore germination protein GerM
MSSYRYHVSFKALCLILAGCAVVPAVTAGDVFAAETDRAEESPTGVVGVMNQNSVVHLYFARRNSFFLSAEQRSVLHQNNPPGLAHAIVSALIKGPQKGLMNTIPAGTRLNALYIAPDGTCYVDLSAAVGKNHPGGSKSELLTVYSMVNSLVLNVPEVETVQILIDGNEAPTLAGHIDMQLPFKANMLLVR